MLPRRIQWRIITNSSVRCAAFGIGAPHGQVASGRNESARSTVVCLGIVASVAVAMSERSHRSASDLLAGRPAATRFLFIHVASGFALANIFIGALIWWPGSPARRLLLDSDNALALAAIFILHAGLFACASFATSMCACPDRFGGGGSCVSAEVPSLAPGYARARRPPSLSADGPWIRVLRRRKLFLAKEPAQRAG